MHERQVRRPVGAPGAVRPRRRTAGEHGRDRDGRDGQEDVVGDGVDVGEAVGMVPVARAPTEKRMDPAPPGTTASPDAGSHRPAELSSDGRTDDGREDAEAVPRTVPEHAGGREEGDGRFRHRRSRTASSSGSARRTRRPFPREEGHTVTSTRWRRTSCSRACERPRRPKRSSGLVAGDPARGRLDVAGRGTRVGRNRRRDRPTREVPIEAGVHEEVLREGGGGGEGREGEEQRGKSLRRVRRRMRMTVLGPMEVAAVSTTFLRISSLPSPAP